MRAGEIKVPLAMFAKATKFILIQFSQGPQWKKRIDFMHTG
jgi:hypothetical protein